MSLVFFLPESLGGPRRTPFCVPNTSVKVDSSLCALFGAVRVCYLAAGSREIYGALAGHVCLSRLRACAPLAALLLTGAQNYFEINKSMLSFWTWQLRVWNMVVVKQFIGNSQHLIVYYV